MRVLRDSTNDLLKVDDKYLSLSSLVDHIFNIVKQHSSNPGFDMPPWFYSCSPYADELIALGSDFIVDKPKEFRPEFLPQSTKKSWSSREPTWPTIFDCEIKQ